MMRKTTQRGQATTELALGSLLLVSILIFGIYFGEVTFAALKVQEATNSALFDLTHYKHHSMASLTYSTGGITNAVNSAQADTSAAYQNFDGRTSQLAARGTNITKVFTQTRGMTVRCARGGGPGYLPNPLVLAAYNDNSGANCWSEADILTSPELPRQFMDGSGGFFKTAQWSRASLKACGMGKTRGGACLGRATIMLDDWGLTGPAGGEWLPAPGLPMGFPSITNPSYWWTTYKAYLTSYWLNAAFKPVMFTLPASQLATFMAGGVHPMGFVMSFNFGGMPWNESTFYLSFNSSLTLFQNIGVMPSEGGIGGSIWETTPFAMSLMLPYLTAWNTRRGNGGCYLGLRC